MKQQKLLTAIVMMGSVALMAGCDEGDDVRIGSTERSTSGGGSNNGGGGSNNGGGGSNNGGGGSSGDFVSGTLIDEAIEGVLVEAESGATDTTDLNGDFELPSGETLTFSIDGATIGEADPSELEPGRNGKAIVTPRQLTDNEEAAANLTQILRSLDNDNNPGNGINTRNATIPENLRAQFLEAIQGSGADLTGATINITIITEGNEVQRTELVPRNEAEMALEEAIEQRENNVGRVGPPDNCPDFSEPLVRDNRALCALSGTFEQDVTLTSDIEWFLDGQVAFGRGDVELDSQADVDDLPTPTLTIEPGTDIFAEGSSSLLKITRGATIQANGTEDNPITFSSSDGGLTGSGEWGAVIIQGFGRANPDPDSAVPNVDLEAGLGFYGGTDNSDNSGTMEFVRIAEGGIEVFPDEEINGLTLAGVGSETTINHIQVQGGLDDGVEWFGGAASVKYLVLTALEDDSLDFDLGWQGNVQFVIAQQGPVADRGIESDNNGSDFGATPRTRPTLANLTLIGSDGSDNFGAMHREGMGGFIHNSIYTGGFNSCLNSEENVGNETANLSPRELVYNNVVFNCSNNVAGDAGPNAQGLFTQDNGRGAIVVEDPQLNDDFIAISGQAANNNFTLDPTGGGEINASVNTADANFLDSVDFVGAVNPDGSDLWFEGWTIEGSLDGNR